MGIFFLTYFVCLVILFLDVDVNPGPRESVNIRLTIRLSNISCFQEKLDKFVVAASLFDIVFSRKESIRCQAAELHPTFY